LDAHHHPRSASSPAFMATLFRHAICYATQVLQLTQDRGEDGLSQFSLSPLVFSLAAFLGSGRRMRTPAGRPVGSQ
jgi:hypothetical protein